MDKWQKLVARLRIVGYIHPMSINSEFLAGEKSGLNHGKPIAGVHEDCAVLLYRQNVEKAKTGSLSDEPLIRAYWQGYLSGMDKNNK